MNKVLVVNKNVEEQKHIKAALSTPLTDVVCVDNVYDAILQLSQQTFTVIIVDASLPEKHGNEFLEKIKSISSQPIFIFSLKIDEPRKEIMNYDFTGSYHDMTMKKSLSVARQLICSNENHTPSGDYSFTLAFGSDLVIEPEKRQVYLKGKKLNLTRKEYDMLFCLASNAGKILSREQLYAQVWEDDTSFNVDDLVKTHIKTLRKKLADADFQYIKNVWGIGYRFEHEPEEDRE